MSSNLMKLINPAKINGAALPPIDSLHGGVAPKPPVLKKKNSQRGGSRRRDQREGSGSLSCAQAAQVDICVVAKALGLETVKHSATTLRTTQHDSLVITPKKNSFYWFSRSANGNPINLVMAYNDCDARDALQFITELTRNSSPTFSFKTRGSASSVARCTGAVRPHAPKGQTKHPQGSFSLFDTTWATGQIDIAEKNMAESKQGFQYFLSRRITPRTYKAYSVGLTKVWQPEYDVQRHALLLPYLDIDGQPVAIRYRYLSADTSQRYRYVKNSAAKSLFGLHVLRHAINACNASLGTLCVVEGELNCMSIQQSADKMMLPLDVVSFGSQTQYDVDAIAQLAQKYRKVIIWADKQPVADKIADGTNHERTSAVAPEMDANDMLVNSTLDNYVWGQLRNFEES